MPDASMAYEVTGALTPHARAEAQAQGALLQRLRCSKRCDAEAARAGAQAEKHGCKVQDMWRGVQQRTTRASFGSALRKLLLSGTEWVQSLSSRPTVATDKDEHDGARLVCVAVAWCWCV